MQVILSIPRKTHRAAAISQGEHLFRVRVRLGLGLRVGLGLGLGRGLGFGLGLAHCGHLVPRLRIATRARQAAREGRVGVPVAHRLVRSPALRVCEVAAVHDEAGHLPP